MLVVCRRLCGCMYLARTGRKVKENRVILRFFYIKRTLFRLFVRVCTMYKRACETSIAARIKESQIRPVDEKPTDTE